MNHRESNDGYEYLIKWDGCDMSMNTWKHENELKNCCKLIKKYWKSLNKSRGRIEDNNNNDDNQFDDDMMDDDMMDDDCQSDEEVLLGGLHGARINADHTIETPKEPTRRGDRSCLNKDKLEEDESDVSQAEDNSIKTRNHNRQIRDKSRTLKKKKDNNTTRKQQKTKNGTNTDLSTSDIMSMKVTELKAKLKSLNLKSSGLKAQLQQRLKDYFLQSKGKTKRGRKFEEDETLCGHYKQTHKRFRSEPIPGTKNRKVTATEVIFTWSRIEFRTKGTNINWYKCGCPKMLEDGSIGECGKEVTHQNMMKHHDRCIDLRQRRCPDCNARFNTEKDLNQHWQSKHGRNYPCQICGRETKFSRESTWKQHMKEKHPGEAVVLLSDSESEEDDDEYTSDSDSGEDDDESTSDSDSGEDDDESTSESDSKDKDPDYVLPSKSTKTIGRPQQPLQNQPKELGVNKNSKISKPRQISKRRFQIDTVIEIPDDERLFDEESEEQKYIFGIRRPIFVKFSFYICMKIYISIFILFRPIFMRDRVQRSNLINYLQRV